MTVYLDTWCNVLILRSMSLKSQCAEKGPNLEVLQASWQLRIYQNRVGEVMKWECLLGPSRVSELGAGSADALDQGLQSCGQARGCTPITSCHYDTFEKRASQVHRPSTRPSPTFTSATKGELWQRIRRNQRSSVLPLPQEPCLHELRVGLSFDRLREMSDKRNDDYVVPMPGQSYELKGAASDTSSQRPTSQRSDAPARPASGFTNSPSASILGYCLASISMTVVNKYIVSGSDWNLMFLYLAIQVYLPGTTQVSSGADLS